jgi:hypothetical protein
LPRDSSAATFRTRFPTGEVDGITVPHRIEGRPSPAVHAAISATACPARSRNAVFSKKSAGGYPHIANSGKTTRPASSSWARTAYSRIFFVFPAKSPTVGLICASAIFTLLSLTLRSPSRSTRRPPCVPEFSNPSENSSSPRRPYPERYSCRTTDPAVPLPATIL